MDTKSKLLNNIQKYDFALDEIRIYLDTHPNCKNGLKYFHKYKKLQNEAVLEYNQLYGPITSEQVKSKEHWTWVNEPWPWERSVE